LCHKTWAMPFLISILILLASGSAMAATNILTPSLTIGGIYDSNINFSNITSDINGSDYIALLKPGLVFTRESKRFSLTSFYTFEAKLYANNSTLNFFTHNGSLAMREAITPKTSVGVKDTARFSQETADAFSIGVQTRRTDTFLNTASIDFEHFFTDKTSGAISYEDSMLQFQDPAFFDTRTDTASTSVAYEWTASTTLSALYDFTSFTSNAPEGKVTTGTHTASLGISTTPTPSTSLALSGGVVYTDVTNSHLNWSATASATKTFKNATVKLGYARSINNSIGLSSQIIVGQTYSIETTYKLGSSNLLSLSGFYFKDKSIEGSSVDFISFQGVLTDEYQLYSWFSILLGYTYIKQEEKADTPLADSFVRNVVYLNFNFIPGGLKF